ncbi:P-loop NTPase family protein [Actinoallomurus rhizosphaericola]|uniref:ABC transporter n=1 Tax=Actinoallomurus rhizosphaericola TaxID=2952536 RepID=UPI0020926D68|nr:ABC transporter [Actinoallomurus rhizosphaericola]MCO5999890.1 ABC transporter [Actinoallomurus rhizosphaericola]
MTTTTPGVSGTSEKTPSQQTAAPGHGPAPDPAAAPSDVSGLTRRLATLDRLVELGEGRVDQELMDDAAALLGRAGDRLRLSGDHTIVALAGGTGSGKSSLFNAVCGLELSPTGLRRPMTSSAHACVWGLDGAGPLLDWLEIDKRHRYARASALDQTNGEERAGSLQGLILLDLPDHDSIRSEQVAEVDRYVGVADLLIWVLDPQKYADFAVHRRYLEPLAGHDGVSLIVLNQIDRLAPEEIDECVKDLRRLLEAEGLRNPRILTTSAKSGAGVEDFRDVIADTVAARRARTQRLIADMDRLIQRFEGAFGAVEPPSTIDDKRAAALVEALVDAAGIPAVAEAMESAYQLRALDYVGWPLTRLAARLRSDPLRRMRLVELRDELRAAFTTPVNAQQAHVDNALQDVTEDVVRDLPPTWRRSVREAGRSNADALPETLGASLRTVVPSFNQVPGSWWAVRIWQYLLLVVAALSVVWLVAIAAFAGLRLGHAPVRLLGEGGLAPYVALVLVCVLGLGLLTALAARNMIALTSVKHSDRMEQQMREGVAAAARELVIAPVEQELAVYARFRDEAGHAIRDVAP